MKAPGSKSAFVSLRIAVGCSTFLVGVFLGLVAIANPMDQQRSVTVGTDQSPTGSAGSILFNQLTGFTLGYIPTQHLNPPGSSDTDAADDFMVFDPQGWTIGQFDFEIGAVASEPSAVDIRIYPDDNGHPGEPAICSYAGMAGTVHGFQQPVLRIPLPTPCVLGQ